MVELTKERIDKIKIILAKLVSGEIEKAWVIIEGTIIDFPSSAKAVNDDIVVIQLAMTGRALEETLSLKKRKIGPIIISNDDEDRGGLDIVIQKAGDYHIIVESKGVIEKGPVRFTNGEVGGTKKRIAKAADEIAKMFSNRTTVSDKPGFDGHD